MNNNIVRSQYIFINSSNRKTNDYAYDFSVEIPHDSVMCHPSNEALTITVSNFTITKNWYYVNTTNNNLRIIKDDNSVLNYTISPSNYTSKQLARIIVNAVIVNIPTFNIVYDSYLNKYIFTLPLNYKFDFTINNSMWYILGFNKSDIITFTGSSITSTNVLRTYLSQNINICIDNVHPVRNLQNSQNHVCTHSTCVLPLINDFAPFSCLNFENTDSLYTLTIKEKYLNKFRITVRDEFKNIMTWINDFTMTLRIDTISIVDNYKTDDQILATLQNIEEYLRLQFVTSNLNKV